jgi:hypothetical protein
VLTELFADQPQTTITAGGTDAPAAGTTQTCSTRKPSRPGRYALVAVDTANHSVNGLSITNNACYDSANPARIASAGCVCSANSAWVGISFYAAESTPTVGRGNMVTTDGSDYSAVPDI